MKNKKYGYVRVSTESQWRSGTQNEQLEAIRAFGVNDADIVSEQASGKNMRIKLKNLIHRLQPGDTLVATKLDRLARNTGDALKIIETLNDRHVILVLLRQQGGQALTVDNTPIGKMLITMLAAVAELERTMISERMADGKAYAREHKQNYHEGPKFKLTNEALQDIREKRTQGHSYAEIAKQYNVNASTVWRAMQRTD